MKINTQFTRVTYHNPDNNFAILKDKDNRTFKGIIGSENPQKELLNVDLEIEYIVENDKKYGKQYKILNYKLPFSLSYFLKNVIGIINKSGLEEMQQKFTFEELDNISKQYNEQILQFKKELEELNKNMTLKERKELFDDKIKEFVRDEPKFLQPLLDIKGVGKAKIVKFLDKFTKQRPLYTLSEHLGEYNITPNMIKKIYDKFGEESINKIKENPYIISQIKNVGFKKADEIALKMGMKRNSPERIKAGIKYIFEEDLNQNGNTIHKLDKLEKLFIDNFEEDFENGIINMDMIKNEIKSLALNDEIVKIEDDTYMLNWVFVMENQVLDTFNNLPKQNLGFTKEEIDKFVEEFEQQNFKLGEKQKEAVYVALMSDNPVFLLAGYAGSGKTTSSKLVLDFFIKKFGEENVIGCSLSGNASNRIKNATKINAFTIHTLLGFRGDSWTYNEDNKLPHKLIIMDESTMTDLSLFYRFIKAVDFNKTKVIFLGDNAQLPPVGFGEVYSDLLLYSDLPKVVLDKVFRQKEEQIINIFAQNIRQGKVPKDYINQNVKYEDFHFKEIDLSNYYSVMGDLKKNIISIKNIELLKRQGFLVDDSIKNNPMYIEIKQGDNVTKMEYSPKEHAHLQTQRGVKVFYEFQIKTHAENLKRDLQNQVNNKIKNFISQLLVYFKERQLSKLDLSKTTDQQKYLNLMAIITPKRNGNLGLDDLNKLAKNILNPRTDFKISDDFGVGLYDKVMHLQNENKIVFHTKPEGIDIRMFLDGNFDEKDKLKVYNGQSGIITKYINLDDKQLVEVFYPNEGYYTLYDKEDFLTKKVDLAYSITIHKSQGSEYDFVIAPQTLSHYMMLNNKLLYVLITRAKKHIFFTGQKSAFERSCKNTQEIKRDTLGKLLLNEKEQDFEIKQPKPIKEQNFEEIKIK